MWQTDPEFQQLLQAAIAEARQLQPRSRAGAGGPAQMAYRRYLETNRARLGIPEGYGPSFSDGGRTLQKSDLPPWQIAALTAGPILGGLAAGSLLGGLGGASLGAGEAGVITGTGIPTVAGAGGSAALPSVPALASGVSGVIPGTGIPAVGGAGGSAALPTAPVTAGTITGTTAAGTSALERLRRSLTSGEGAAALASLVPLLATAGRDGSNTGNADLSRLNAITEARMRRADPLHQVAVQLAYGRAPISARNGISLQNVPLPE